MKFSFNVGDDGDDDGVVVVVFSGNTTDHRLRSSGIDSQPFGAQVGRERTTTLFSQTQPDPKEATSLSEDGNGPTFELAMPTTPVEGASGGGGGGFCYPVIAFRFQANHTKKNSQDIVRWKRVRRNWNEQKSRMVETARDNKPQGFRLPRRFPKRWEYFPSVS
ncbi:hypothetical protein M0802_003889 [Mischocyttarus mexicanus]|nr:hypothetical protein M0802_003889 [Mischocyttarus mexicanus]